MDEVVCRYCPHLVGYLRSTIVRKLVSVYLWPKTHTGRGSQYPHRQFGGKDPTLAEDVAKLSESSIAHGWKHLVNHHLRVFFKSVFRGNGMGPEEGGNQATGVSRCQTPHHSQNLQFIIGTESVSALDFKCGRSQLHSSVHPVLAHCVKFAFASLPGLVHRFEYSSAFSQGF